MQGAKALRGTIELSVYEALKQFPFVVAFRCSCDSKRSLRFIDESVVDATGFLTSILIGPKGLGLTGLVSPLDQSRIQSQLKLPIHEGGTYQIEYRMVGIDGHERWVEECGVVRRSNLDAWIDGQIHDIDKRKNTELAIQASEARFKSLARLSSDWFWEQDADLRFTWFSSNADGKTATETNSIIGKRRWELKYHFVTDAQMAQHREQLEAHIPFRNFEWAHVTVSGNPVWYEVSGDPVFDDEGLFRGYRGIGRNIDAKKQAQLALIESEAKLAQIVDGCSVPIFVIDAMHRVTHWNRACARVTGVPSEAVVGTNQQWRAVYPEERPVLADLVMMDTDVAQDRLRDHYRGSFSPYIATADAIEGESFYPSLGSDGRWLYVTAAPLRDNAGHAVGAVETLQDFTERRRAEERITELNVTLNKRNLELAETLDELKRAQEELVASAKLASLGSLVAGIAHELNTPVGNALTVTTALTAKLQDLERSLMRPVSRSTLNQFLSDMREGTDLAERSLYRTANLIRSFKQIAVDQSSERQTHFDLQAKICELVLALQPALTKARCSLVNKVPSNFAMEGFPGSLIQVLTNLIENACVHAFDGPGKGCITITAKQCDMDQVHLIVSDNGVGIPPQNVKRIFDPFYTTKLGQGGSGLGLNIVHNIVTGVLRGRVVVRSVVGVGTDFELLIPRCMPPFRAGYSSQRSPAETR